LQLTVVVTLRLAMRQGVGARRHFGSKMKVTVLVSSPLSVTVVVSL
jgi:hypothetical protein